MADKQHRPRTATSPAQQGTEDRRPVRPQIRPPMDNGIFALLRRGNQAMNERVAASRGAQQDGPAAGGASVGGAPAAAALEPASYTDVWADVQDMIAHGDFSFRQLVTIIDNQPELEPEERVRMKEDARRLYQDRRTDTSR